MPSRKRSLEAADGPSDGNHNDTLHRIRNMWHFANLIQWIYTFGKAARIDESLDVEVSLYPDTFFTHVNTLR